jgi:predicted DNA-binding transcriptional regulator AlpA
MVEKFDIKESEAAKIVGLSVSTLFRLRHAGDSPRWQRRGKKLVFYSKESLLEWQQSKIVKPKPKKGK